MAKTVMIVEDNPMNMRLFKDLLEMQGYRTVQSVDGADALDLARHRRPDLVIMDIQLPNVSGVEITRRIRSDTEIAAIPIIAVTAFGRAGDEERFLDKGFDAYLSKPISVQSFMDLVERFLSTEAGGAEPEAATDASYLGALPPSFAT